MLNFRSLRKKMVQDLKSKDITNAKVLGAMSAIPRENFITEGFKKQAYEDEALPLFEEQTISQPYTVAFMLQLLELKKGLNVLEIGTGSGYNSALISWIVNPGKVCTIEINKKLFDFGKNNLKNYKNVRAIHADGSKGLPEKAPFDRIIVTAASPEIPSSLLHQLKDPGILVAPIGPYYCQEMVKLIKSKGKTETESYGSFIFVPLKGG